MAKIEVNVEKVLDRGPKYGFIEAQVSFEEKSPHAQGISFASVIVPLAKAEVGSIPFDQVRSMALSKALSFMEECIKNSR